jgi:hypothetical protein
MAQIFNVACPSCRGSFPVHPELWQSAYDLLCPFCGLMFPQETSPMIVTGSGERRPGSAYGGGAAAPAPRSAEAAGDARRDSAGSM